MLVFKVLINNSIKLKPPTNIWINGKVFEEVDQLKYLGSTKIKDGTLLKEDQTGTGTLGHDK